MKGFRSATVIAVMAVTVMGGAVEVLAQDQPAMIVRAGENVSVQASKQYSKYGYFQTVLAADGKSTLHFRTCCVDEKEIGKADLEMSLTIADQDTAANAASQLEPNDPIGIAIAANGVIDVKKISHDAVLAAMGEEQRQYIEALAKYKEDLRKRQRKSQGGQGG